MITSSALWFAALSGFSLGLCVLFALSGRRRKAGRLPARLLLAFASVFFCLFLAEVLLPFVVNSQLQKVLAIQRMFDPDPLTGFKWKKSAGGYFISPEFFAQVKTNPLRLRNPETGHERQPGGPPRLLLLGDSFTAGYGVGAGESFAGILQKELAGRAEVINAGVNGYGPLHELMYYYLEGRRYRPDQVLLCFYPGDLMDGMYLPMEAFAETGVSLAWVDQRARETGYAFAAPGAAGPEVPGNLRALLGQAVGLYPSHRRFDYAEIKNGRSDLSVFLRNPQRALLGRWRANLRLIRQLAGLCRSENVRFAVAAIPMWVQVHPGDWRPFAEGAGLSDADTDLGQPQEVLAGLCEELGVPLLDALPALKKAGAEKRLYFRRDDHLNPAGHAALADFLLQQAQVPPGAR